MPATLYLSHDVPLPRTLTLTELRLRLRAMMKAVQLQTGQELSVFLTNDEHIQQLNHQYRQKNKPTDVLAFALQEAPLPGGAGSDELGASLSADQAVLGDVVVSLQTAAAQAQAADKPLLSEVTMLLAHGLLHLLGWDHDTAAKDRAMRAETDRLIACAEQASAQAKARAKAKAEAGQPPTKTTAKSTASATPKVVSANKRANKASSQAKATPKPTGDVVGDRRIHAAKSKKSQAESAC